MISSVAGLQALLGPGRLQLLPIGEKGAGPEWHHRDGVQRFAVQGAKQLMELPRRHDHYVALRNLHLLASMLALPDPARTTRTSSWSCVCGGVDAPGSVTPRQTATSAAPRLGVARPRMWFPISSNSEISAARTTPMVLSSRCFDATVTQEEANGPSVSMIARAAT
jgi:hypothetical protein